MRQISGNKLLVKALKEEGVDTLFGYPGACTISSFLRYGFSDGPFIGLPPDYFPNVFLNSRSQFSPATFFNRSSLYPWARSSSMNSGSAPWPPTRSKET